MVNQERNVFAALLVALGEGDGMITGLTRTFSQTAREIGRVLDHKPGATPFGMHMVIGKNHTTFLADTVINERPSSEQLAHIAKESAAVARRFKSAQRAIAASGSAGQRKKNVK